LDLIKLEWYNFI